MTLRPFFPYFGGKWTLAPHYPAPAHDVIIEPFAGSAGYATRWASHDVIIVERAPKIAAIWRWLIGVSVDEVMALPLNPDAAASLPDAPSSFVRMWCTRGGVEPPKKLGSSSWMRSGRYPLSFWGESIRLRTATQVESIRHWSVIEGNYSAAPDVEATWFIDPPYARSGRRYRAQVDDYGALATWCQGRSGQVIVCEEEGANWLPFTPFRRTKSIARGAYNEVAWFRCNEVT